MRNVPPGIQTMSFRTPWGRSTIVASSMFTRFKFLDWRRVFRTARSVQTLGLVEGWSATSRHPSLQRSRTRRVGLRFADYDVISRSGYCPLVQYARRNNFLFAASKAPSYRGHVDSMNSSLWPITRYSCENPRPT